MNFIVNEKMHAEKLIETGEPSQRNTSRDLKYIAKYLLGGGFSEDYTISFLIDYMDKYNGSGSRWKNAIVGVVKDIRKQNNYYLRDIQEIRITQKEIEVIKGINWEGQDKDRLRKYAFGLIVYCKILRQKQKDGWVRMENTSVFCKDINIRPGTLKQREITFNKLQELELLETPRKTGSDSLNILFVDWTENDDDIIISLDDIEEFMKYYDICILGSKFIKCVECGKVVTIVEKSPRKYCEKCSERRNQKHKNDYIKKHR